MRVVTVLVMFKSRVVLATITSVVLLAIISSGSVAAATTTKVTWKISSLTAAQVKNLSAVVSTNSPGVKTWSKKGSCILTPSRKPTRLTMGATGSCRLTLKIAKSGVFPARTSQKTITIAPVTTVPLTCATGGSCAVGDIGPGGGKVFYVASSNFTSDGSACGTACRYLEVAPTGWITAPTPVGQTNCGAPGVPLVDGTPGTSSVDPFCELSGNTSDAIGSTGTGIGTGYANTSAIINQNSTAGKAATVARAFQGGEKTDWFLPSKDELNTLCKWVHRDTVNAICNNLSYGGLDIRESGFLSRGYLSSSEAIADKLNFVWYQFIPGGYQNNIWKTSAGYVRPVRAF
jgi:hypothetical protein